MKMTWKVEGLRELDRALGKLSTRASKSVLRQGLLEGAEPIRAAIARYAPHRPGRPDIRENIVISNARTEDMAAVAVGPAKPFFYGRFQEEGTAHHAAQPFMRPGFDEKAKQAIDVTGKALWRELAAKGISRSVSLPTRVQHDGPLL